MKPRPSISATLLAIRARVSEDLATAPYELKQAAVDHLEPMLNLAYVRMYEGRGWYTSDDVAEFVTCPQRRAAQIIGDLRAMGLVARDTQVVNGRKRLVYKAV